MPAPAVRYAVLVLSGLCFAAMAAQLPSALTAGAGFVFAGLLALVCKRWQSVIFWTTLGVGLLYLDARSVLVDRLDRQFVGVDVDVLVRIVDFPEENVAMRLRVEPVNDSRLPRSLRLTWYGAPAVPALGECWLMTVRLRRPRGFSNPGRFDYEGWLMRERIGATGYVRAAGVVSECPPPHVVMLLRQRLFERIRATLPPDDATAVLLAVTLGARQWIDDRLWQSFAATGTSHLMAISGMHVALAAGAMFLLARALLAVFGVSINQRHLAAVFALLFAAAYASVSGLGVPARRAFLMLLIVVIVAVLRRRVSAWQILSLSALMLVGSAPLDALSPGFKLSFAAVALLVLLSGHRLAAVKEAASLPQRLGFGASELCVLQVTLLLGLLPLTAHLFGRVSWISPAANMVVLPLFNFLALPAGLAGALLPGALGEFLLLFSWRAMHWILSVLDALSMLPVADLTLPRLGPFGIAAALIASAATLLPPGWPLRSVRWIALLALVSRPAERPPAGCVDIDVLDVGQGLAAILRTRSSTMVYDTGPAFRSGGDTGRLVVVPFLKYLGDDRVDILMLSHGDLDHAGGAASLQAEMPVSTLLHGELERRRNLSTPGVACRAGQVWFRDGVRFTVLHPTVVGHRKGNNASCVLEVSAGHSSAILTGDIEAPVERALLRKGYLDPVDLVVVPHHGSKTSSHAAFVQKLSPKLAIASAGFGNRWEMPRADVVERWSKAGARFQTTADSGAIGVRLCPDRDLTVRYRHRRDQQRFWQER